MLFVAIFSPAAPRLNAQAQENHSKRPRVALVLEGGGALGIAHIGVLKALEAHGIPIDMVVGTSMGSIIGGLYAMGYDSAQIESIVLSANWGDLFSENDSTNTESYVDRTDKSRFFTSLDFDTHGLKIGSGLLSGRKILELFDRFSLVVPTPSNFDSLPRPFRAVATDLADGKPIVIDHGSIADAMRASMSIPGVFSPYYLEGRYLVDGGLVQNLPVETAKALGADIIIAVDLRSSIDFDSSNLGHSPIEALSRSLDILVGQNVARSISLADYVIPIDIKGYKSGNFKDANAILALGEASAAAAEDTFAAIRSRIGTEVAPKLPAPQLPKFGKLIVSGGREKDLEKAKTLCAPLVGTVPDQGKLAKAVAELENIGEYEYIRMGMSDADSTPTLVVSLEKKPPKADELNFSFAYESTYSETLTSSRDLGSSLVFNNLTGRGSRLEVGGEIFDAPGLNARYSEPILQGVDVEAYVQISREYNTSYPNTSSNYDYQAQTMQGGCDLDYETFPGERLSLGWSYASINELQLPDPDLGIAYASILHAGLSLRRLDSPIFPMDGLALDLGYTLSLPELGSQRAFSTLDCQGYACLSLHTPFSLSLLWKAGTDFSKKADDTIAAPHYYKPTLAYRLLFPGPMPSNYLIGSYVAGGGVEAKLNLDRLSRSVQVPVFILGLFSTGICLQNAPTVSDPATFAYMQWTQALGVGVRVNDAFGISLKGGAVEFASDGVKPFISLDFGAIGY